MKNSTETVQLITTASITGPLAYDYRRQELYWVGRDDRETQVAPNADEFGLRIHIRNVQEAGSDTPRVFHSLSTQSKLDFLA